MNRKFLAGLLGVCFVVAIALPSFASMAYPDGNGGLVPTKYNKTNQAMINREGRRNEAMGNGHWPSNVQAVCKIYGHGYSGINGPCGRAEYPECYDYECNPGLTCVNASCHSPKN